MPKPPATIDDYLARVPADQRAALESLRRTIRAAAPKAEECISYQMPAFRQGRMLVGFAAAKAHCSFFPMSSTTVAAHEKALAGFETSKGTIRFTPEQPLPAALVKKIVKARLAENAALDADRPSPPPAKRSRSSAAPEVDRLLAKLDHPLREDIDLVRELLRSAAPGVREEVKWNAPSFRTTEFFATLHVREKKRVLVVLHRGAKSKDGATDRPALPDPKGLVRWLAQDRCLVSAGSGAEVAKNRAALRAIFKAWLMGC